MSQPEISLGNFVALTTFAGTPFRFVKFSSGKLAKCGAGESGIGVIQDEPVANEAGNVMCVGVSKVLAGGTISQGNSVKSDANGKAVATGAADPFAFGIALEGASDGEYFDIFLTGRAGDSVSSHQAIYPALGTNVDGSYVFFKAPYNLTVSATSYTPVGDITGAATNHRKLEIINKGTDGNGTDVVADLAFDNGVNALDYDEKALTLSGTAANLDVDAGEVLAWVSTTPGTGIADPGGLASITFVRR